MLALPHTNSWGFVYTNQENGSVVPGTAITPGTSSSEGSWTQIASGASIASEVQYVVLQFHGGATSGAAKSHFLDFGWDPAGGTSYAAFFQDYAGGLSNPMSTFIGAQRYFHFPCKIPSGSTVAIRIQGSAATAGTVRVAAWFYGKPSRPELWRPAAYSETLGAGASTLGAAFTPGNAGWGSWASLGTTTKKHFWVQAGVQIDNTTISAHSTHCQLGIGDGTNLHLINDWWLHMSTVESIADTPQSPCAWEIPAGAELWIRGNNSAAPVSGYNATAVLFGG